MKNHFFLKDFRIKNRELSFRDTKPFLNIQFHSRILYNYPIEFRICKGEISILNTIIHVLSSSRFHHIELFNFFFTDSHNGRFTENKEFFILRHSHYTIR